MSNLSTLIQGKGRLIRQHGLLKKTPMVKSMRNLSDWIHSYVDETTKHSHTEDGRRVIGFEKAAMNPGSFLKEGIDYLSKEPQGNLRVYGFLRDDLHKHLGVAPHRVDNRKRIEGAYKVYSSRIIRKGITTLGHRFVISIDPNMCEIISAAHMSIDEVLNEITRTTMRRFQERFYPDDRLGYMVGIHHDRKHIHAHILMFPTTENGKLLAISDGLKRRNKAGREDRLTFLRETTQTLTKRFYEQEVAKPILASTRSPDVVAQRKLIGRVAIQNYATSKLSGTDPEKWRWIARERSRLESLPDDALRLVLTTAYEDELVKFGEVRKRLNNKTKVEQAKEFIEGDNKKCREQMFGLKKELRGLSKEFKDTIRTNLAIRRDLSAWKRVQHFQGTMVLGKFKCAGTNVSEWLVQRMSKNDEFGAILRTSALPKELEAKKIAPPEWVKEKQEKFAHMTGAPIARLVQLKAKYAPGTFRLDIGKMEEDVIRQFLLFEISDTTAIQEKISIRRKEILEEIQGLQVRMGANTLDLVHTTNVERKEVPHFISQYEGWKLGGVQLPVYARRNGKEAFTAEAQANLLIGEMDKRFTGEALGFHGLSDWQTGHERIGVKMKEASIKLESVSKAQIVTEVEQQGNAFEVFLKKKPDNLIRKTKNPVSERSIAQKNILESLDNTI